MYYVQPPTLCPALHGAKVSYGKDDLIFRLLVLCSYLSVLTGLSSVPVQAQDRDPVIIFGVLSSNTTMPFKFNQTVPFYWRKAMRGALYVDVLSDENIKLVPKGMDIRYRGGFSVGPEGKLEYQHVPREAQKPFGYYGAVMFLDMLQQNPEADWFLGGDDDTFWVADNLVHELSKRNPNDIWYIGAYSERPWTVVQAYGGSGIILSAGALRHVAERLERCASRSDSVVSRYGDHVLANCILSEYIPVTLHLGMHQMDWDRQVIPRLEHHPVVPLLSLHRVFPNLTGAMKEALAINPAGFAQQTFFNLSEIGTISISSGVSLRIWTTFSPTITQFKLPLPAPEGESMMHISQPQRIAPSFTFVVDSTRREKAHIITTYEPDRLSKAHKPTKFARVIVHEPDWPSRWTFAPQRLCLRKFIVERQKHQLILHLGRLRGVCLPSGMALQIPPEHRSRRMSWT